MPKKTKVKLTSEQSEEMLDLCGRYVLAKHAMLVARLKIIKRANELGIGDQILAQLGEG